MNIVCKVTLPPASYMADVSFHSKGCVAVNNIYPGLQGFQTIPPGLSAILGIIIVVAVVVVIISYFATTIPFYKLLKKADYGVPWLAFIPIANFWPGFWLIRRSPWNLLWFLAVYVLYALGLAVHSTVFWAAIALFGIAVGVLEVFWAIELFRAFGMTPLWLLLLIGLIIPGINLVTEIILLVILWVMAFNERYQYQYSDW